MSIFCFL